MGIPEPGSKEYEDMVEFMRKDLESGMQLSKVEIMARDIIKAKGGDFDKEYEEWLKAKKGKPCVVCGRRVDWYFIKEEFAELLEQADHYGVDSLTEAAQVVYEGKCCSMNCYLKLD